MAPGPFATGINGGRLRLPESAERMRTHIPLGRIAEVERLYLRELMKSHDAVEGLQAFLDKRPAQFKGKASEMPAFYPWWE